MATSNSIEIFNKILETTEEHFNIKNATKVFNVEPRTAQTIQTRISQSNDFLKLINNIAVEEIAGDILGFGVPKTLTKRTTHSGAYGKKRRPTDPTSLEDRMYFCHEVEQDAFISWHKLDQFVHLDDFYYRFRDQVLLAQATDQLKVGWNGQFSVKDTDPDAYPELQDVQPGWIQFLIDNCPENVLGLEPDGSIKKIKVGNRPDADFKSIDALVYHIRNELLHRLYRKRRSLRVLVGDDLIVAENKQFFDHKEVDEPSEKLARDQLLARQQLGRTPIIESDEFPLRALWLCEPENMSRYWQRDSLRRKLEESHDSKGIVDWNYVRYDLTLEAPEGAACAHPDAIQIWDEEESKWVDADEQWRAEKPTDLSLLTKVQ